MTLSYRSRFEPIYQYRIWGGQCLAGLLSVPLPDGAATLLEIALPKGTST